MSDEGGGTWLRPASTWLAFGSIVLVLVNSGLQLRNQSAQRQVNLRQQQINQAPPLSRASQILIETTAKIAVTNNDEALKAVLEKHGIKLNVNPTGAQEKKP